jgi:hypothetical protein
MDMARRFPLIALLALTVLLPAMPAYAQSDEERYTIMRPEKPESKYEPWLAPKYKSSRGTRQHVVIPQPSTIPPSRTTVPPPLYVPKTGQLLPNLPAATGAGPGGRETSQDRAVRCAHQAGVYGPAATGDRNSYIGSCINQ